MVVYWNCIIYASSIDRILMHNLQTIINYRTSSWIYNRSIIYAPSFTADSKVSFANYQGINNSISLYIPFCIQLRCKVFNTSLLMMNRSGAPHCAAYLFMWQLGHREFGIAKSLKINVSNFTLLESLYRYTY